MNAPILPGATIGILGSGQLGRMLALAARRMGYRVHTFSPDHDTPTGQVADREVSAPYEDLDAVRAFARRANVVTFEFENVPAPTAEAVATCVPVYPDPHVLFTAQHRLREKTFLARSGVPVARFRHVRSLDEVRDGLRDLDGAGAVLKTVGFGYDGKGQVHIDTIEQAEAALQALGGQEAILEERVAFASEVSVVAARHATGAVAHYGVIENTHRSGILDVSVAPATLDPRTASEAIEIACAIMEHLGVVGMLCVEFFLTTRGALLVNEIAPRPHNSGHLTIEAAPTSQFEQHVRAVCGLPLGATTPLSPAAMANLLGDLWAHGEPDWTGACATPRVALHLYGKQEPRPGRKMGHLTAVATTPHDAKARAMAARGALRRPADPSARRAR